MTKMLTSSKPTQINQHSKENNMRVGAKKEGDEDDTDGKMNSR